MWPASWKRSSERGRKKRSSWPGSWLRKPEQGKWTNKLSLTSMPRWSWWNVRTRIWRKSWQRPKRNSTTKWTPSASAWKSPTWGAGGLYWRSLYTLDWDCTQSFRCSSSNSLHHGEKVSRCSMSLCVGKEDGLSSESRVGCSFIDYIEYIFISLHRRCDWCGQDHDLET